MAVIINDRDVKLMSMCASAKWLTTAQVHRYLFAEAGERRVAKRLRQLRAGKFVHAEFGRIGNSPPMLFHTLGPAGRSVLLSHGWQRGPIELHYALPKSLAHFAGVNDIRISVSTCECRVNYFFAHWQLDRSTWPHATIPDAGFCVEAPHPVNFLVEFDRGTEPRSVLLSKLERYAQLRSSFSFTALLFVVARSSMVGHLVQRFGPTASFPLLVGTLDGVIEDGILAHRFVNVSTSGDVRLLELSLPPEPSRRI